MKKFIFYFLLTVSFVLVSCNNESEQIQLGGTFPLTGEVASYGISAKNGIQLKIDEVNAEGGIKGRMIEVDFQDDKNSVKDAVSIFNSFATIQKYPVVFGSAGSTVSLSLAPIANRHEVILMSPVSSSGKLSDEGGKYFFRTVPADNLQAETLADWAKEDGIEKVAIVYTNNSWGKPLADGFEERFTQSGGEVLLKEGVNENITDFGTIILKLRNLDIDAIISPTYPKEGGQFVKQLKENNIDAELYGGDNWGAPEFLDIAKNAADGAKYTFPAESKSPLFEQFKERYDANFTDGANIVSAYAYDAATAIVLAMQNVEEITSENIRKALLEIEFEGVSDDVVSFKPNGDVTSGGFGKRIIMNGKPINYEK